MDRIEFLRAVPLCADLEPGDLEYLAEGLHPQDFRKGQFIFQQGEPGRYLYIVQRGRVRAFTTGPDGQEITVNLFVAGDMFGEQSLLDGLPRSATAEAVLPTQTLALSHARFRQCLQRSPALALALLDLLSKRLRVTTAYAESLITLDLRGRLIALLVRLAQQYGQAQPAGTVVDLGLSQSEMASIIGVSRESLNRALNGLRDEGTIDLDGRIIIVRDLGQLQRASQVPPSP